MKSEFYGETCCDYCGETIHNHFDCPVCGEECAGTSIYASITEWIQEGNSEFSCEECGAKFRIKTLDADFYREPVWIERLESSLAREKTPLVKR